MSAQRSNEPSDATYAAVGQLCVAWSYVEMLSEKTLWGILGLNVEQGRAFVWRMQLASRWQMIVKEAARKFDKADVAELRAIKKMVDVTQRDRNVVVHGVVHAMATVQYRPEPGTMLGTASERLAFKRIPCWTIYMGDEAGKNFPISTTAVHLITANIMKIQKSIQEYNLRSGFTSGTPAAETVEENWPKRL